MKAPKKPIKKSPLVDPDTEMEDANDEISSNKKKFDDEDDDFDMPLDDIDSFDSYGSDDDDDDY